MEVTVSFDTAQMAAIDRKCGLFANDTKINAAITRAAKRAADSAKAETKRQIPELYTVPGAHVGKTIKTERAGVGAAMRITDSPIALPIFEGVTPKKPTPKQPKAVTVKVKRQGGGKTVDSWFVAQMKSTHIGVFRRKDNSRLPIEQKFGPATTGMFKNPEVVDKVVEHTQAMLSKRLDHEIERMLNG